VTVWPFSLFCYVVEKRCDACAIPDPISMVGLLLMKFQPCGRIEMCIYTMKQKTAPFYFCDNFGQSFYIGIIIGIHIPQ